MGTGSAALERAPAGRGGRRLRSYLVAAVLVRVADEGARVALVVLGSSEPTVPRSAAP